VVWWDPAVLGLGVQESVGLSQQKLLEADERGVRSEEGVRAHAAWQAERMRVREAGGTPGMRVVTATEQAAEATASPGADITVETAVGDEPGPHGKRFGSLVHGVLATVDLDAGRRGVERAAELQGRLLGATDDEVTAAVETVIRALAHPLLRRAAVAGRTGRCRRETPVAVRVEDVLVEGVVDVAFLEDDTGWTVVDFKTDVELEGRIEEYRRQVGLYVEAIARATGRQVRGVLLRL
jgi:ATP-dependent exoDNAse (exonuclease V) beta subunit